MINRLDRDDLRQKFQSAKPFPYVVIENLLVPGAAEEVAASFPSFDRARELGFGFNFVNEQRKIQITDAGKFPEPVRRLQEAIASPQFLADLEYITGIPRLLADDLLEGGGMHLTGTGGRLDVHVDFNVLEERKLFRRLNILLYLNPTWQEDWLGRADRAVGQGRQDPSCELDARPQPVPDLRDQQHQLSRRHADPRAGGGRSPILRSLLLHARGPRAVGRNCPLDDLQGAPRRDDAEVRPHARREAPPPDLGTNSQIEAVGQGAHRDVLTELAGSPGRAPS